ncbi:hypothetical protein FPZ43_09985 [Mucilaginibacter pallidiroseus]|uniref:Uncharacterized protein n=1 Tax=Mucilaginibacter pallidiroseus TaxID=2599295 RepID=A0A563UD22_9SPHI|nr:DUF6263 family protein [Mucilaginibacter pallidiroseus]TWR29282.1 hypothetical protein FPZ43_09985 [Mucilaginibacter pallidiroseus]
MNKIFTLLLSMMALNSYAQKAKLELKLQKDSTYYLTVNAKMNIDQLIQGTHQIVKSTITGSMAHKVVAIKDTIYDMDVIYKSLAMEMEIGGRAINFDSESSDTTNMFTKVMKNLIGKSFTIVMSKRGQVVAVKNTERMFESLFKGFPQIDEQKKAQLLAQFQQSFGAKTIKGNLQESFVIFPKTAIVVKGTWTNQTNLEAAVISSKTNTRFTLDNITNNAYEITGNAVITPDKAPVYKNTNNLFMRLLNVGGSNTTRIKIDKKTGWIIQSTVVKHVISDVELKQTLDGPVMMTYPMVIDANMETKN